MKPDTFLRHYLYGNVLRLLAQVLKMANFKQILLFKVIISPVGQGTLK